MSVSAAFGHLSLYIALETMYAILLLIGAWVVGAHSRRFVGGADVSRTSYVAATFPIVQALILTVCMRYISFVSSYQPVVLVVGSLVCLLAIGVDLLLMRAIQASADKAAADAAVEATARATDDYLARFAGLERSIELTSMLRHDIRNQLGVIDELTAEGERDQALALVEALQREAVEAAAAAGPLGEGPEERGEALALSEFESDTTLSTERSFAIARGLFFVSYLAMVMSGTWLMWNNGEARTALFVLGTLAAGALLLPALFRMLRDAHDADVAVGRARAAEALLEVSREQGERLEDDAAEAGRVRADMTGSIERLKGLVCEGDSDGLAAYADETALQGGLRAPLVRARPREHAPGDEGALCRGGRRLARGRPGPAARAGAPRPRSVRRALERPRQRDRGGVRGPGGVSPGAPGRGPARRMAGGALRERGRPRGRGAPRGPPRAGRPRLGPQDPRRVRAQARRRGVGRPLRRRRLRHPRDPAPGRVTASTARFGPEIARDAEQTAAEGAIWSRDCTP